MTLAPGDVLHGKYRIERVLGEGGMGVVMLATHLELDQAVALKFLLPAALEHPEVVERFAREAKAAAKIRGAHAVKVLDVGRTEQGAPFMVMEYLEGRDLGELLAVEGALEAAHAVDLVLEACEGLAEAHAAGIVHRDLKPSNLFLASTPDGGTIVKVLDFGISKVAEQNDLTRTNAMMGTAYYMSPEQLTSPKNVDARSDIWAIGVVLYVLLSDRQPFDAETLPEVVALILQNEPSPLGVVVPSLPAGLGAVVHRCMASRREARYQSLAEASEDLAPFGTDAARRSARRIARVLGVSEAKSSIDAASLEARIATPSASTGDATVVNAAPTKRSADGASAESETLIAAPPTGALRSGEAERSDVAPPPAVARTSIGPRPGADEGLLATNEPARPSSGRKWVAGAAIAAMLGATWYLAGGAPTPAASSVASSSEPRPASSTVVETPRAEASVAPTPSDAPIAVSVASTTPGAGIEPVGSAVAGRVTIAPSANATSKPPSATSAAPRPPAVPTAPPPASAPSSKPMQPPPRNPLEMDIK